MILHWHNGDLTIFKMAAVPMLNFRTLEFVTRVTSIAVIFCFPMQNFTEIGQSVAELWQWHGLHGLFKELIIGPLKLKMAELRHLENREMAISQRKSIRFWWNLVHNCRFKTQWQLDDQICRASCSCAHNTSRASMITPWSWNLG